jgi:nicotinamide-nucleotide amidase
MPALAMPAPAMPADPLAASVVASLVARGETLATAESLTGGLIGAAVTAVPGSSAAYRGGVVTYATELKHTLGRVPAEVLERFGVISPETAAAMASGVREAADADWGLAVTGVAGPEPQEGHEAGEVWVGLAGPGRAAAARRLELAGDRDRVRTGTVAAALGWLDAVLTGPSTSTRG